MLDMPEQPINPPEDFYCEECGRSFYPEINQEWRKLLYYNDYEENEPVLCSDCATLDG
jgi:transcription elongation factor Elf1